MLAIIVRSQAATSVHLLGPEAAPCSVWLHLIRSVGRYRPLWAFLWILSTIAYAGQPPGISVQPIPQTIVEGSNAVFTVTVTGAGPFHYQWQCNGSNLPNNIITTVAGNGTISFSGDGGPATNASLGAPLGVAVDTDGNIFIADTGHARIRKVSTNGIIVTVAGQDAIGFSGDGGAATNASLRFP